jgi:hypothetical protein
MGLCFSFLADKSAPIKNAASATLQQAVTLLFDRACAGVDLVGEPPDEHESAIGGGAALESCEAFFCDMVCCAGGVPSQWMRRTTPGTVRGIGLRSLSVC